MRPPFAKLPDDVLTEILVRLPAVEVVRGMRVCKQWRRVTNTHRFWVQKCRMDDYLAAPECTSLFARLPLASLIHAICKRAFERNLLADDFTSGPPKLNARWKNGGAQPWRVECPPVLFGNQLEPERDTNKVPFESCLVSSCVEASRSIAVDLRAHGLEPQLLDALKPTIVAREHFSNRWDCGCWYAFRTEVKREQPRGRKRAASSTTRRDEPPAQQTEERIPQWEKQWWRMAEHRYTAYPDDHSVVELCTRGSDTRFWAGNYGVKIAGTSLVVKFESNRQ
ncbi:F-box only protein 6 [Aphelenchoides fujianensis]|nr:F-box only protein 6 [Aphelenchoides fujianensis]